MARHPLHVREATPADAPALLTIWSEMSRRQQPECNAEDEATRAVARIAADPDERLLLATLGDEVAGAVHLRRAPISPMMTEWAVHVSHLQVRPDFRRHGVGSQLMEAAVSWAEEKDLNHVLALSATSSREANRFMARLGLGQVAVVRVALTSTLRGKLPADLAVRRLPGRMRHQKAIGHVLAERRSMRRMQSESQ